MDPALIYLVDITLATLLLRMLFGLFLASPHLLRFVVMAFLLWVAFYWAYYQKGWMLPLSQWFVLVLALPSALLLLANILPELRRVYQSIHLRQLLGLGPTGGEEVVPELTLAICEMAKQKIGALFVFPGVANPDDLMQGGESIQAQVNKSLLFSIFNTTSPRHDGAILIRDGKIVRIGAVLPLASANGIQSEWGTRHLAALGLSQQCDAQVLVVSEERGAISLASGGEIKAIFPQTEGKVRAAIHEAMGRIKDEKSCRRRRILNLFLWLNAILFAVAGAFIIDQFQHRQEHAPLVLQQFNTKVVFTNRPPHFYLEGLKESNVKALFLVPRTGFRAFESTPDFILTVDLAHYPPGTSSIKISSDMLNKIPDGWKVDSFMPNELSIRLAEARNFDISIEPVLVGLSDEFRVKKVSIDPPSVEATVRDSQWTKKSQLETRPIDLSGVVEPGSRVQPSEVQLPESIKVVSGNSRIPVTVTLDIVRKTTSKASRR